MTQITGLATTGAVTSVKNKILNVKKQIMMQKYQKMKYFTTFDYNRFTRDIFDAKRKGIS